MKKLYDPPVIEVVFITMEECILSGGNGSSESIGYDDDPFGGGGN